MPLRPFVALVIVVVGVVVASCSPAGSVDLVECGAAPGSNGVNAQFTTATQFVHAAGAGTWTSALTLIGSEFVSIPQLDLEFLVQEEACTHRLTLNVRAPTEGAIPFGVQSVNGAPVFSGVYAGDLPSQAFAEGSTLELTALTDNAVSGRFVAIGAQGQTFDLGAFTNVVITGMRPPDP